jgi:hypothetical protein
VTTVVQEVVVTRDKRQSEVKQLWLRHYTYRVYELGVHLCTSGSRNVDSSVAKETCLYICDGTHTLHCSIPLPETEKS